MWAGTGVNDAIALDCNWGKDISFQNPSGIIPTHWPRTFVLTVRFFLRLFLFSLVFSGAVRPFEDLSIKDRWLIPVPPKALRVASTTTGEILGPLTPDCCSTYRSYVNKFEVFALCSSTLSTSSVLRVPFLGIVLLVRYPRIPVLRISVELKIN